VVDYRVATFEEAGAVDVVFDTVGGEAFERSLRILRPGGRIVTIVSAAEGSANPRVREAFFIVEPNRHQLTGIGTLLEEDRVRPVVDSVVPFAQAPDAYAGNVPRTHRGKVVVSMAS
jgi:NADPH:quinone reductase-like Zn-dependent oxidoreductase